MSVLVINAWSSTKQLGHEAGQTPLNEGEVESLLGYISQALLFGKRGGRGGGTVNRVE